jgi:F-type H+-transporting ATPase subunit gamma
MAQTQLLNRRIRSVKNAKQITKAMEVVAASRMRRVQEAATKTRAYGEMADSIVRQISNTQEAKHHPFFRPSQNTAKLYVVFSSDRGLAGAFNSNIFSNSLRSFNEDKKTGGISSVIVFGRKGARFFSRFEGINLVGEYENLADAPDANIFAPVIDSISNGFSEGQFGTVNIIYTEFVSTLSQSVRNLQLLPVPPVEDETARKITYELEPTNDAVLTEAMKLYLEAQLMRAKVDSSASEYAMRMLAMNSANKNASDLIEHLTLELNASRQASITQEMAEITGGANAVT